MDNEEQFSEDFNKRYQTQMETEEKQFIKGFNAGYQLSQHEPELLERILKSPNEDKAYIHAMQLGKKQHDREKALEQIKQAQQQSKGHQRGK